MYHKCKYSTDFHQYFGVTISKEIASSVKTLNSGYALSFISTVTMNQQRIYAQSFVTHTQNGTKKKPQTTTQNSQQKKQRRQFSWVKVLLKTFWFKLA